MNRYCAYRLRIPVAALCVAISGCGGDGLEKVPVSGKVTVDGQPIPGPGRLFFTPVDPAPGVPTRAGTAKFDAEGNYKVQVFEPGDGLMPGRYQIGVDCWKSPPNMEGRPVVSYVAEEVRSAATSGLEITIEPGSDPVVHDIDVPGAK